MDTMKVEILPDGSIKTTTDQFSRPVHSDADGFLAEVARLAGGVRKRIKRSDSHSHVHNVQEQRS
jgi:hypothetical protein